MLKDNLKVLRFDHYVERRERVSAENKTGISLILLLNMTVDVLKKTELSD